MKTVRIWTPESNTDSKFAKIIADKIIKFYKEEDLKLKEPKLEDVSVIVLGKSNYNDVFRKDDGLLKAVTNLLKQCDFVIFLLDFDGIQSHAQRRNEPNSHINKIESVINRIPEKTKLLYMCQELEAWPLIDCLGVCCYFKNADIREDGDWIKFSKKSQSGKTDLITEAERGGNNAKEYLVNFSRKVIKRINPDVKPKDIDQKEYTENTSDRVAEFVYINQETINRNDSLKKFSLLLCEIAKKAEGKPQRVMEK